MSPYYASKAILTRAKQLVLSSINPYPYLPFLQGYEDMDEFEDALSGTFIEFLQCLPHVETMVGTFPVVVFLQQGNARGWTELQFDGRSWSSTRLCDGTAS